MENAVLIGTCGVDSGTLILVDPCYIHGETPEERHDHSRGPLMRQEWLDALYVGDGRGLDHAEVRGGVVFGTADGDGGFPVYAIYEGQRLKRVEVRFDDREGEEEDDPDTVECDSCPAMLHLDEIEECEDCGLQLCDGCYAEHVQREHPKED